MLLLFATPVAFPFPSPWRDWGSPDSHRNVSWTVYCTCALVNHTDFRARVLLLTNLISQQMIGFLWFLSESAANAATCLRKVVFFPGSFHYKIKLFWFECSERRDQRRVDAPEELLTTGPWVTPQEWQQFNDMFREHHAEHQGNITCVLLLEHSNESDKLSEAFMRNFSLTSSLHNIFQSF